MNIFISNIELKPGVLAESFTTINDADVDDFSDVNEVNYSKINYSKMPDDILSKVYFTALGLLGLYIFLRMFQKKQK